MLENTPASWNLSAGKSTDFVKAVWQVPIITMQLMKLLNLIEN